MRAAKISGSNFQVCSRIKKSGSNSKTIGIVFCCKIGHIWSFLKRLKQWRLYTCKNLMTSEAANLKLRRVSSSEQYPSEGEGKGYICLKAKHT